MKTLGVSILRFIGILVVGLFVTGLINFLVMVPVWVKVFGYLIDLKENPILGAAILNSSWVVSAYLVLFLAKNKTEDLAVLWSRMVLWKTSEISRWAVLGLLLPVITLVISSPLGTYVLSPGYSAFSTADLSLVWSILKALPEAVAAAALEEYIYRGVWFSGLVVLLHNVRLGTIMATLISALTFAAMHAHPLGVEFIRFALYGAFLNIVLLHYQSLIPGTFFHGAYNFSLLALKGGNEIQGIYSVVSGPHAWVDIAIITTLSTILLIKMQRTNHFEKPNS